MGNRDSQKDGKSENVSVQKGAEDLAGDLRNCESKSNESVKGDSIPSTKGIDEEKSNTTKVKGNLSAHDYPCYVSHMSAPKSLRAFKLQEQKRPVEVLKSHQGTVHQMGKQG